jgi:GcrA cell cycle regulator
MDSLIGTSPIRKFEWFKWTDQRVELLTKLLSDGYSGSQIAAELGGVTRNAVIGTIHRMGLVGYREKRGGASYRRNRSARAHSFEAVTIGDEATDLAPEVVADPVTLMELQEHHCRWPHDIPGEPMMYCGAQKHPGYAYCARHCRMAYRLPERRRAA